MSNYQDVARQAAHRANDRRGGCTVAELADAVLAAVLQELRRRAPYDVQGFIDQQIASAVKS